jgi:hypothetical protein
LDLHLRLIRLSVAFSTKTTRYREIMNSWCLILGFWNPQTPFEPIKFLSFIAINHSLHYVLLKALFNQVNNLNR